MGLLLFSFPVSAAAPIEQSFDTTPTIGLEATEMPQDKSFSESSTLIPLAEQIAGDYGLNKDEFLSVIECESAGWQNIQSFVPGYGPNGREDSWGLAQIHLPDHPEVTRKQALNPEFALEWMAYRWEKGHQSDWSCWNQLYK